jgi:CubicO group peptidase (beta-lactamase class C family)
MRGKSGRMRACALALSLLAATAGGLRAQEISDEARRALNAALDSAAREGFVGHALVARGGRVVFEASRGMADAASRTPVDSVTVFSIGSVTKQFTRAAILKLEEEGKLSLSDPVSRFVPGLPEDKRAITLGQLLDMRAGLGEYHDNPSDSTHGDHQRMTKEDALARIGAQRLRFAPGTGREYSNSGYTLLAAVVEAAAGRPFEEYVRSTLIEPAGMTSTGFYGESRWADRRVARGTGPATFGEANAPHRWPPVSWVLMGAGGMVSNARDLHRWILALRGGKILGPAALAKFHPREPAVYAGGNDFGFGTLVLEFERGADVVIVHSSSGVPRMNVGVALAETAFGRPVPEEIRTMFARRQAAGAGPGGPAGPDRRTEGGEVRRAGPDTPEMATVRAFLGAIRDGSPDALRALVTERFTEGFRAAASAEEHARVLGELSEAFRRADNVRVAPRGAREFEIRMSGGAGETVVVLTVEEAPPHRISSVSAEGG